MFVLWTGVILKGKISDGVWIGKLVDLLFHSSSERAHKVATVEDDGK